MKMSRGRPKSNSWWAWRSSSFNSRSERGLPSFQDLVGDSFHLPFSSLWFSLGLGGRCREAGKSKSRPPIPGCQLVGDAIHLPLHLLLQHLPSLLLIPSGLCHPQDVGVVLQEGRDCAHELGLTPWAAAGISTSVPLPKVKPASVIHTARIWLQSESLEVLIGEMLDSFWSIWDPLDVSEKVLLGTSFIELSLVQWRQSANRECFCIGGTLCSSQAVGIRQDVCVLRNIKMFFNKTFVLWVQTNFLFRGITRKSWSCADAFLCAILSLSCCAWFDKLAANIVSKASLVTTAGNPFFSTYLCLDYSLQLWLTINHGWPTSRSLILACGRWLVDKCTSASSLVPRQKEVGDSDLSASTL